MAFAWNTYYEIQNVQYGTYINLYGNHSGSTIPNGNVISLWARTNDMDQKWMGAPYENAAKIVPQRNTGYVMNMHSGNSSAIAWPASSASVSDTCIDFITVNADENLYRLKLYHRNLYLTATGANNTLFWQAANNNDTQLFRLLTSGGGGITMNDIPNQYYSGNSSWIRTYGCALCCGVVMAEWEKGKDYSLSDFAGHYDTVGGNGYYWTGPDGFSASAAENLASLTEAQTIARIRQLVNAGTPVACHLYASGDEHWVVAYSATGSGTTWATSGITVLDPFNASTSSTTGLRHSISTAMNRKSFWAVDRIRTP